MRRNGERKEGKEGRVRRNGGRKGRKGRKEYTPPLNSPIFLVAGRRGLRHYPPRGG